LQHDSRRCFTFLRIGRGCGFGGGGESEGGMLESSKRGGGRGELRTFLTKEKIPEHPERMTTKRTRRHRKRRGNKGLNQNTKKRTIGLDQSNEPREILRPRKEKTKF